MSSDILAINDLSVSFLVENEFYNLIEGLSLSIKAGETFALLGESGCGKSLTASALLQLLPNNAYCHGDSQVLLDNQDILSYSERALQQVRGNRMAMIFQEPMTSLNPVLTIGQQIAEVLSKQGVAKADIPKRALALLEMVELPMADYRMQAYPHQLSGGQKQRVVIAMAIAAEPDLLIADEPTTALDVTIQAQILSLMMKLKDELNMAILFISHDLSVVKQYADTVGIMYAGQLVEIASCSSFFERPKHPYSQKLLSCLPDFNKRALKLTPIPGTVPSILGLPSGCRFRSRCEHASQHCEIMPEITSVSESHKVRCHHWQSLNIEMRQTSEVKVNRAEMCLQTMPFIELKQLKVYFSMSKGFLKPKQYIKAVDGIDLCLYKGQTLALVGESGCGKTTLSRTIVGLQAPTSGEVILNGKPIQQHIGMLAKEIQIVFQDPFSSLDPRQTVGEIIGEGLRNIALSKQAHKQNKKKIFRLLDAVGLPSDSYHKYPHQFSGGQRQRVSIARALAISPKLLICDEPTSALDVSVQAQILNLLTELQQEFKLAYLFISHDMSVVSYLADQIAVMKQGQIVEQGDVEQVLFQPQHDYTKTLLKAINR